MLLLSPRDWLLWASIALLCFSDNGNTNNNNKVEAFAVAPRQIYSSANSLRSSHGIRFLSDVPQDDDAPTATASSSDNDAILETNPLPSDPFLSSRNKKNDVSKHPFFSLPPAPEDAITLIGDLLSLTVYGVLDHLLSHDLAHALVQTSDTPAQLAALVRDHGGDTALSSSATTSTASSLPLPVWVSPHDTAVVFHTWQSHVDDVCVSHYSPLLSEAGSAVVVLSGAWILAGWLLESFAMKHTLFCTSTHVLAVTARTWVLASAMVWGAAFVVSQIVGAGVLVLDPTSPTNVMGGPWVASGDITFVTESLSGLVLWRYLVHFLLGGPPAREED